MVTCDGDGCGCEEEIQLCPIAPRGGYDERYVDHSLEHLGWLIIGNNEYCEECRKEYEL